MSMADEVIRIAMSETGSRGFSVSVIARVYVARIGHLTGRGASLLEAVSAVSEDLRRKKGLVFLPQSGDLPS